MFQQENGNIHDPYAVAVMNDGAIVDMLFLLKDGAGARTGVLQVELF